MSERSKAKCSFSGCKDIPLRNSDFCWPHLPNKEKYRDDLILSINKGENLQGCNLQKIELKGAYLEKANLSKANLSQADFSGAHLFDTNLEGSDLIGTNFADSDLTHCNMQGADLTKATMVRSRLWNTDLRESNLIEADLSFADLWNARLFNSKIWHTSFKEIKSLTRRNFFRDPALMHDQPKINETGLFSAEESYRDLKGYFILNGMYNDASWAAFKEKTMERLVLKKSKNLHYFPSLLMNILCGYGEKPHRIVLSAVLTIFLFAGIYAAFHGVEHSTAKSYIMTWSDYLYYSTITYTTVGYGDFIPKPYPLYRLLAASEAFIGIFLTGLFVFTLARKYSAR